MQRPVFKSPNKSLRSTIQRGKIRPNYSTTRNVLPEIRIVTSPPKRILKPVKVDRSKTFSISSMSTDHHSKRSSIDQYSSDRNRKMKHSCFTKIMLERYQKASHCLPQVDRDDLNTENPNLNTMRQRGPENQ